ncbi:ABC transporter ATP-binding protein [Rhodococcus sp. BP-349]|uniref:ABC transporter ATP-binding protein n=1 Tax=unclassified Rhodococcus (in: high G+C Gram-positive bacteria) TaxID=192944 RepID=UPI001C9ACF55|nr:MULTISPECIES: ABC transporter ATP-binding protein [unclassified Rhodococcus (in: high G+C Gram-positive bacteria)]MBY6539044.1 ABC transporter ATP-binding protein [Rhodococcus sp. BP-363]MBY6543381.1 ABC transporter ATP-binding protein [Rhodococcus sp. BP-369]MBY6562611.1 ABC transporter ATP-binding protein [Rhodococcus sp. BP-370]MBY6576903.1 ABC transporter ATP-binding protein [Rhodococcus sp. BP-364]MBY6586204.1 ABC transporter ATP-binding protein [Rhodococcus sp. BP-358]
MPSNTIAARKPLSAEVRAALFADVANTPGVAKPDPTMVVDGVSRTFGGLKAVDVAHLEIQRGCITGLIGPNGAGKTTLFNLLTGFDQPDTGSWSMDGKSLGRMTPHQVARHGVVRTFQLTKALSKLTVLDNVRLGATGQKGERIFNTLMPWTWKAQEREVTERARDLLARFKLDAKSEDLAGSLSGGQRKLLEMARALMTDPAVVMLDEPMAGVNPALTQSLLGHIKSLRDDGMTVVFVEHDMDVIRDISDWVVVMAQGSVIAESAPAQLADNEAVVDAYLGSHHDQALEFDADGNPVGATAELAEALEQAEVETLESGGDLSEAEPEIGMDKRTTT